MSTEARIPVWSCPTPSAEIWLARKLGRPEIVLGATTAESRRDGFRKAILERCLANHECGRKGGTTVETYAELFARWYGEALQ